MKEFFKKVWNGIKGFFKNVIDKITDAVCTVKDAVVEDLSEDGVAESVITICTVIATICVTAMTVKLFLPIQISSSPVIKMSIPVSALLAAKKGGLIT